MSNEFQIQRRNNQILMPFFVETIDDHQLCVLIDTGSTHTFLTPRGRDILQAEEIDPGVTLEVKAFNSTQMIECEVVQMVFWTEKYNGYVIPNILTIQPVDVTSQHKWVCSILDKCVNTNVTEPLQVDVLLGLDNLWIFVQCIEVKSHYGFALFHTRAGLVFGGNIPNSPVNKGFQPQTVLCRTGISNEHLSRTLEKLWEINEPLPHYNITQEELTIEENQAINLNFKENLKFIDKRYEVGLTWKCEPELVNNYGMAKASVERLQKRLEKNQEMLEAYEEAMTQYIENNDVELDLTKSHGYFLPHHGVFRPDHSTTKCRIVFNGSAKTANGNCLNDFLLAGPKMLPDIVKLLLKLRNARYFLIGDISRMYMQIGLKEADRRWVRFLWYDPRDHQRKLKIFRFTKNSVWSS